MKIDDLLVRVKVELSEKYVNEILSVLNKSYKNMWEEQKEKLTVCINKGEEYLEITVSTDFEVFRFLYSLKEKEAISCIVIADSTLENMYKVKKLHDLKRNNEINI